MACLGLDILGSCNYNPADPPRAYFTIGQLISVIALLLAFSQLAKPITRFRLHARNINTKTLSFWFAPAICFIFVAAVLPFIPGPAFPLFGFPVFWEILAGLLCVIGAIYWIAVESSPPGFRKRNAKAYLDACAALVASGNDDDLGELAIEIRPTVHSIFEECKTYDEDKRWLAGEKGKTYPVQDSTRIAFTILDLWSDSLFCKNIVCRAPGTAIEIFEQLVKSHSRNSSGYALSRQLVHQAFTNRESILMREENYSGLGFFKQFRRAVFGNWYFLESNHRPLQAWRYYEEDVESWQAKKYCECLHSSFETYFYEKDFWQYPASLSVGLEHLAHMASTQVLNVRRLDEHTLYNSSEFKILGDIQHGLATIVDIVEKNQNIIPQYNINEDTYSHFDDPSPYGVVAYGIYEFFEALSQAERHDHALRLHTISLWLKVFGVVSSEMSSAQEQIGKRLVFYLKKKIDENLDLEKLFYPPITRLLITLNGIHESNEPMDNRIGDRFHREFIQRLKRSYPIVALKEPEFAKNLLPESAIYDQEHNAIQYRPHIRKVDVLTLDPYPGEKP
jgi:hypothetical protein